LDQGFSPPSAARIQGAALQIIQRHDPSRTLEINWAYDYIALLPPRFESFKQKPMKMVRYEAVTLGFLVTWYGRLQITIKIYRITEKNLYSNIRD
jgi:hypothetical protein